MVQGVDKCDLDHDSVRGASNENEMMPPRQSFHRALYDYIPLVSAEPSQKPFGAKALPFPSRQENYDEPSDLALPASAPRLPRPNHGISLGT
jgi:hypothetical protein